MREISSPLDGFASPFGPQRGFNPLRIFANDEPGVWFEANDANTLFTHVAGTTPVTTPGDAVALQLDKSQGAGYAGGSFTGLGPELVTNGDFSTGDLTGWTIASWTVIDEQAVGSSGGASLRPSPAITIEAGKTYQVTFTVISSPFLSVNFGGVFLGSIWPSGTYTRLVKAVTTANLSFAAGGGSASTIDNVSVRELPGNHRTQATTAARPLYALHPVGGVRNLLEYTEDYSEWLSNAVGGEEFDAIAPDGTSTALKVTFGAAANEIFAPPVTSITGQTVLGFFAKADSARPLNISATVGGVATTAYFGSANLTSNWQFFEFPKDSGADEITQIRFQNTGTTEERTVPVYVWHPQLEQSSTATNYQRVGSFLDVSEEGKARRGRIWYNGTSHFMETGTITPGTDKVQVFAGVRKLSDAAAGILIESSTISETSTGAFGIAAPGSSTKFIAISRGTLIRTAGTTSAAYNAPTTRVVSAFSDISGDRVALHIDGTQVAQSTGNQGTGNYLAYPIYFGARAGTSLFFNGYEDTSIIRFGPNLDAGTIGKVESYVASKTPEPTL